LVRELFERIAADELEPEIKAQFEKQAASYRRLAEGRAAKIDSELPPRKPE
jgi:hypothetical protein